MTCSLPQSVLAALLVVVPVALAASPAQAQDAPAPPPPAPTPSPDAPLPPSAQPLPSYPGSPYYAPAPYYGPAPYYAPAPSIGYPPDREHVAPADWYGWQTLIAVAPFDVAMFASLAKYSQPAGFDTFVVAFTARNLVPAVVHLAHGRTGRAFGSIGLQAAATATGLAVGYAFGLAFQPPCQHIGNNCHDEVPQGAGYGAIIGSMAGTVLDVVFFAHRTRLSWTAAQNEPSWTMAPFATQRSAGLALSGTL